jgi:glutamate-1-semialdehyde 2,1-aminomutase
MKYINALTNKDLALATSKLEGFIPEEIYDIHAHSYKSIHFTQGTWPFLKEVGTLGCREHRNALSRYMPAQTIHGLYFGMPHQSADRDLMNQWMMTEVKSKGTNYSRALRVTSPYDSQRKVAEELRNGLFCGIKPYHCYASRPDTMNALVSEFAPEWMWETLNETRGILMLHIVRNSAIEDANNQRELQMLCRAYPRCQVILAHIARSFNYRNARNCLYRLTDLDNVVVDTSAVCETEAFRAAWETFGPRRILWGSDYPISEVRGRCVTTGSNFLWLHPQRHRLNYQPKTLTEMTLIGIEFLLTLRELCEDAGMNQGDVENLFLHNSLRLLKPHIPAKAAPSESKGPELWQRARTVISGGTGLLSKRAERFDVNEWPSYFSQCSGCEVWDMSGRRYIDFAGGIGAVLLGYADPDVNAAVKRRLSLGTYCSLVDPQEIKLAETLLGLHPWAGKVHYARGGGEAMTVAVRIARAATGHSGIAFCGYHGWHDWYLAANLGKKDALDGHLLSGLDPKGVPGELCGTSVPFDYNDVVSFDLALQQLNGNIAAVVMEPMRSQHPKNNFIFKIAERCREIGAVFIVDEVTSGLRYGFPGALSKIKVDPDIVVYAKAISNGIPFAAIIGRDEVMKESDSCFISSSYWTDGIGTAAALAVLEKVQRLEVQKIVWDRGIKLKKALKDLSAKYPSCKLSIGGMPATPTMHFQLGADTSAAEILFVRKMCQRGVLVSSIFYIMLAHEERHINYLLDSLESVLKEIEQVIVAGRISEEIGNINKHPGFDRLV